MAPAWAWSTELVVNGSFEVNPGVGTTNFTGWTQVQQANSRGAFYVHSGSLTPVAHFSVPTPPLGSFAALTDQTGPGSRIIYQDVAIPVGSMTILSLSLLIYNQANYFASPASLDFTAVPNQQVRIDIMSTASSAFDVNVGVLRNVYQTQAGNALTQSYAKVSADLSAFAGQQVRLRIATVDNLGGMNVGIDNVGIQSTVISPPGAPSIASVQNGPGWTRFTLTQPASSGGGHIIGYTVTCSASGQDTVSRTDATTEVTMRALKAGVSYSCTATAINEAYSSPASAALPVVATGKVDLTPILLLLLD